MSSSGVRQHHQASNGLEDHGGRADSARITMEKNQIIRKAISGWTMLEFKFDITSRFLHFEHSKASDCLVQKLWSSDEVQSFPNALKCSIEWDSNALETRKSSSRTACTWSKWLIIGSMCLQCRDLRPFGELVNYGDYDFYFRIHSKQLNPSHRRLQLDTKTVHYFQDTVRFNRIADFGGSVKFTLQTAGQLEKETIVFR